MPDHFYRVDNIPILLQPVYWVGSWLIAVLLYLQILIFGGLCRVEYTGMDHLDFEKGFILTTWHENLPLFFMTFLRVPGKQIWMNHPAWYMKPVHIFAGFFGVKKLTLGSSGNAGKQGLETIIQHLNEGWSTTFHPDGPAGPAKSAKYGVLKLSAETGVPIIPICFEVSNEYRIPTWDKKRYPFPFARIKVELQAPFNPDVDNLDQSLNQLEKRLNGLSPLDF